MNQKLCKILRREARNLDLPKTMYEQSRGATINTKETERGFYRHLKRNVREITS